MATISANINISSADITSSAINISNTMTMTKAGTNTGLDFSSGLISRKFTAVTEVDLVATGAQMYGTPTATANANKLYIKNTGSSTTEYITIGIGTATQTQEIDDNTSNNHIGRLYGGDWMLIPFHGVATNGDITVKPSTAEVTTVEWMLFFQ
jgi:hypothetical protein|tara:strand:+ start:181 stop:639 length:459 start_codon:yes stop_codon:yes gene_type:complete